MVGEKYLCVIVKFQDEEAFIVTAYFTDQIKEEWFYGKDKSVCMILKEIILR